MLRAVIAVGLERGQHHRLGLSVDQLPNEEAPTLKTWRMPLTAAVGAETLVTADADGFKTTADDLGLAHQVCKRPVLRNTDALIENLLPAVAQDRDGSLAAVGVTVEPAQADLARLGELIRPRQPEQQAELQAIHSCYLTASPPRAGQAASLADRRRLLFLDC